MSISNSISGRAAKCSNRSLSAVLIAIAVLLVLPAKAWDYDSEAETTSRSAQWRMEADFTKKWKNGLRLGINEELRFDLYNSANGAAFRKSYTTLSFGYAPIQYVKLDVGYSLKVLGPDSTWSATKRADINEYLRHRVFFTVTASYKFDYAKLYLRERVLMEARTDSVNPLEKNQVDWQLRSRLGADFLVPGKPYKPYLWGEIANTLNAPEYQQKNGHQFICNVRAQAGIKWRVSKLSSLDFYYRFTYGYDRDINITKKKGYIQLTEEKLYQHSIGVAYNLDW